MYYKDLEFWSKVRPEIRLLVEQFIRRLSRGECFNHHVRIYNDPDDEQLQETGGD